MGDSALPADPSLILLLWIAFLLLVVFVFNGINSIELDADARSAIRTPRPLPAGYPRFETPESVSHPIGRYMGTPIYEKVVIGGTEYRFDHIVQPGPGAAIAPGEHCIPPGVVYTI